MKKPIVILILLSVLFSGCRTIQYVPVKETEYVTVTLVQVQIEKEYIRDYRGLTDTLVLRTSLAESRAWIDTSKAVLAGEIKNRENVINVPVSVKEKVIVKDSLVYKDVPVPVEVIKTIHPKYEWALWAWGIVSLLVLCFLLYRKIMPIFVARRFL